MPVSQLSLDVFPARPSNRTHMSGTLEQIWIKRAKLGPMDPVSQARLRANRGLVGNANMGGRRQVTIIEAERWAEHMAALGATIDPSCRRANLLVRGFPLADSRGKVLRIGNVRLQIAGETKPCHQMDEVHDGLQALMRPAWGGGAFAIVLDDGEIHVGDSLSWEDPAAGRVMSALGTRVRRGEDYLFDLAAKAEYKLKITPRGMKLVPTRLHRWILRAMLSGVLSLVLVMAFTSGATRTRAILVIALGALLAALALLWWDARIPEPRPSSKPSAKPSPRAPAPPPRRPTSTGPSSSGRPETIADTLARGTRSSSGERGTGRRRVSTARVRYL